MSLLSVGTILLIVAYDMSRWIRDDQNIRSSISACLSDLRRERDKVINSMKVVISRRDAERQRIYNHKVYLLLI